MSKPTPNLLQKFVRKMIRDLILESSPKKEKKSGETPKKSQTKAVKSISKINKTEEKKKSRYIPPSVRVEVLRRNGYKCVFCGRRSPEYQLEVDHIVPFSKGGTNELSNLQTLCLECNRGKGARSF